MQSPRLHTGAKEADGKESNFLYRSSSIICLQVKLLHVHLPILPNSLTGDIVFSDGVLVEMQLLFGNCGYHSASFS